MKKMFITSVLLLFCTTTILAQTKRIEISKFKVSQISADYSKSINLSTKDTLKYVYLGFQNAEFKSVTDIKSIMFTNQNELDEFVIDLKTALPEMDTKQNIDWDKKKYSLAIYNFNSALYLKEGSKYSRGYTMLSKKDVEKLIIWLESIVFEKG